MSQNWKLPLTLKLGHGEPATSYASRLAARNGISSLEIFGRHLGVDARKVASGDETAVHTLAIRGGVNPAQLLHNTPRFVVGRTYKIGRETLNGNVLLRSLTRFCPVCLIEDQQHDQRFGQYQRVWWQIEPIRVCSVHSVRLIARQSPAYSPDRFDFARIVRAINVTEPVKSEPNDRRFERYIERRLRTDERSGWLDEQPIHVVAQFSSAIGTVIDQGAEKDTNDAEGRLIAQTERGFSVMAGGPEAIVRALKHVQENAGNPASGWEKLYGRLGHCLNRTTRDPNFDSLRHLCREFVLDNFLVAGDSYVFGARCEKRRLHSISSASFEYDVPAASLSRQLAKNGHTIHSESNHASSKEDLFRTPDIEIAAAEVAGIMTAIEARKLLDVDRYVFERLISKNTITPHFSHENGIPPVFHKREIEGFVRRLDRISTRDSKNCDPKVEISEAARKCHCTTNWIIDQVLDGKLNLFRDAGNTSTLRDFYVSISEVKRLLSEVPEEYTTTEAAANMLRVNAGTVHELAERGYLKSYFVDNRLANRLCRLVQKESIENFSRKYVAFRTLSGTRYPVQRVVKKLMKENDVHPLELGNEARDIYSVDDLKILSAMEGGENLKRLLEEEGKTPKKRNKK